LKNDGMPEAVQHKLHNLHGSFSDPETSDIPSNEVSKVDKYILLPFEYRTPTAPPLPDEDTFTEIKLFYKQYEENTLNETRNPFSTTRDRSPSMTEDLNVQRLAAEMRKASIRPRNSHTTKCTKVLILDSGCSPHKVLNRYLLTNVVKALWISERYY